MNKFLGLWNTTDFCFIYYYVSATILSTFDPTKTQYIEVKSELHFPWDNLQVTYLRSKQDTRIREFLHSIHHNYNGLPDTTLESVVGVVCVAKFQSNLKLQQLGRDARHTDQEERAVVGADRSRRLCRRHHQWVERKDKKLVIPHSCGISTADV